MYNKSDSETEIISENVYLLDYQMLDNEIESKMNDHLTSLSLQNCKIVNT